MPDPVCDNCGSAAAVVVTTVDSSRRGVRPTPIDRHYCSACAREFAIRISGSPALEAALEPPSWSDIERRLEGYADILEQEPDLRDMVMSLAQQILRTSKQLDGPMPSSVAAAFVRIGISPSTDSTER